MQKYLFYDLEFITLNKRKSICEFGYVLTDNKLNILDTNQVFINPNLSDYVINTLGVLKKKLKTNVNNYLSKLDFSYNFNKIVNLFNEADLVLGYGNETDALVLNSECRWYDLPYINHKFVNIQKIYCYLQQNKNAPSLKQAMITYGLKTEIKFHIAQNDAFCTYSLLNKMLQVSNFTLRKMFNRIDWVDKYSYDGSLYSVNCKVKPTMNYKFLKYIIQRFRFSNRSSKRYLFN